jgi:parallel beta-helix repeat protein
MTRTLHVSADQPGAFPSIRDALEVAGPGSTISIAAGEYAEPVALEGRTVSLVAAGKAGSVIIDATASYRPAVSMRGGQVTLRGLVLRAGDAAAVSATGGQLRLEECQLRSGHAAAVRVTDAARLEASASAVTGGQYGFVFEDAGGLLDTCEIVDVSEDAVIVRLGADPTIRNCTIARCGFRGIYVYQSGRPTIERRPSSAAGYITPTASA